MDSNKFDMLATQQLNEELKETISNLNSELNNIKNEYFHIKDDILVKTKLELVDNVEKLR
jgi:hypothetical protein